MATVYKHTYTVVGRGTFPLDMLRHDAAYPRHETDSAEMDRTFEPRNRETHSVTLVSLKPPSPRWESFRWQVTELRREKVPR